MEAISGFGIVLLFMIGGIAFVMVTLLVSALLHPNRPNPEKMTTYESGEDPVRSAWNIFNIRFYVIALIFLLFETELCFLFPWATIFADPDLQEASGGLWGRFALTETFIFIGILLLGLIYVWKNGMLDWARQKPEVPSYKSPVPAQRYKDFNQKDFKSKNNGTA